MKEDIFFDMEKLKNLPKENYVWDEKRMDIMVGKIVRIVEAKRFGFLEGQDKTQYFFHQSDFNGFFDDLIEDLKLGLQIQVRFDVVKSDRGPRASNVSRFDAGAPLTTD